MYVTQQLTLTRGALEPIFKVPAGTGSGWNRKKVPAGTGTDSLVIDGHMLLCLLPDTFSHQGESMQMLE